MRLWSSGLLQRRKEIVRVWLYVQADQSHLIHPVQYISWSDVSPGSNSNPSARQELWTDHVGLLVQGFDAAAAGLVVGVRVGQRTMSMAFA